MLSDRVQRIAADIAAARPGLCAERARLITHYFRDLADPTEPTVLQKARALAYVLAHQPVHIHERELLVGNPTGYRVGGALYPELIGLTVLEDIFSIERRAVNPMQLSGRARWQLLMQVLPYWARRNLPAQSLTVRQLLRYFRDQTVERLYVINEAGGIAHVAPDYRALLQLGTEGLRAAAEARAEALPTGDERREFYRALVVACQGLEHWAQRYRDLALQLAAEAPEPRAHELRAIAERCAQVPARPARSLAEGLQSLLLAQIALNLESLDNGISPGRLDQILDPLYQRDLAAGALDHAGAMELLGLFALKLCEIVPVFSDRVTAFHGGLMSGQAVVIGGTDRAGQDATTDSTWLWLELMEQLRVRQPNLHARLHPGSPPAYRRRVAAVLSAGSVNPAIYTDAVIVPNLQRQGASIEDARDYAIVGCVEPVVSGAGFMSTDAALVNVPAALAQALGLGGRRGDTRARMQAAACTSMEQIYERFELRLQGLLDRLMPSLQAIETGNARCHPTPLTSLLLEGCMASGRDASAGGARYNGSGIQCVGAADTGDALAALEQIVFREQTTSLAQVIAACQADFVGHEALRARLRRAPKYGNGDARTDQWVSRVMRSFASALAGYTPTRGGRYVAGFYSMTCHHAFGQAVAALPSGRQRGESFASGISPHNGVDRRGPTAALLSQASLPMDAALNGLNFNLKLAPWIVQGEAGITRLQQLLDGSMAAGCMQMQFNIIDPAMLIDARDNPGKYPGLLVRVSGYSAYFDDLAPAMKQEIIDRTATA